MAGFLTDAGLVDAEMRLIAPRAEEAGKLTVAIWIARDPRLIADDLSGVAREYA
jgi:demethylmenaquinone methyltransferase/2-methoxy-6-polyprenyl-1,4-benzoquinol methylase/ArsR family transcriptional regulator